MIITYKEMFEKSKEERRLQGMIAAAFITSIRVATRAKEVLGKDFDAGELMLKGLSTIAEMQGYTLTGRDEITAEYMAEVLNSYEWGG